MFNFQDLPGLIQALQGYYAQQSPQAGVGSVPASVAATEPAAVPTGLIEAPPPATTPAAPRRVVPHPATGGPNMNPNMGGNSPFGNFNTFFGSPNPEWSMYTTGGEAGPLSVQAPTGQWGQRNQNGILPTANRGGGVAQTPSNFNGQFKNVGSKGFGGR